MNDPVANHLSASGWLSKRKVIANNFLGGLAWGVGSAIGATVVVAILIGVLRSLNFIPGITDLANQISRDVGQKTQQLMPNR